jgi:hypothetical protein
MGLPQPHSSPNTKIPGVLAKSHTHSERFPRVTSFHPHNLSQVCLVSGDKVEAQKSSLAYRS